MKTNTNLNLIRTFAAVKFVILAFAVLLPATECATAQFLVLETKDLRLVHYGPLHAFLAPYTARCFENSLNIYRKIFDYRPTQKTTVLLHDMSDFGNAGAGTVPKNQLSVAIAPVSFAFETVPTNERISNTMHHELVHIVASDQATGSDRFFRGMFFGKVQEVAENPLTILYSHLTVPRRSAPRWYHEGIAVFMETWVSGGFGRALGAYDEMVFRTMVRDSARIYDLIGIESEGTKVDFQLGVNSYLYGARFMSYLALIYSPEQVIDWVARRPGSKAYFGAQFHHVFGKSLDDAWYDWIAFERRFQQANLDSIRRYPSTEFRIISPYPLGSVSRGCYDSLGNKLYVGVNYPGKLAHIAEIDLATGAMRNVGDIKGAALISVASIAFDPQRKKIFYTTDNNDWRDLCELDLQTGKSRRLQKDARVGDLAFSPADSSLWGVRHAHGISTIVRIPYPYAEWNQVHSWAFSRDVYDLSISPDGSLLSAALSEANGDQKLILMRTGQWLAGDTTFQLLYDFGNSSPAAFTFTADGSKLYGSSYYSGVSNIFSYDLAADSMTARSNAETGLFQPLPYRNDSLIVFAFTGQGFLPAVIADHPATDINAISYLGQQIVEKHPIVTQWRAQPPSTIPIDSMIIYRGEYHALANLGLVSAYPVVEGYSDYVAYGMKFNISGPIAVHSLAATISYTPNRRLPSDERLHASANYDYGQWNVSADYNGADFYDLFGPTKTSRKGYSLAVRHSHQLIDDGPKSLGYNFGVAGYGGLRKLPEYQNITTSYDRFVNLDAGIRYSFLRASIGAIDYEKGVSISAQGSSRFVRDKIFPRLQARLDLGLPLPLKNSSFWLRNYVGYSPSKRIEPLGNFYFGGFGNNWIDYQSEKRYRSYYSFPGLGINAVGGTTYGRVTGEWILPPLRFRRVGIPTFFCSWARLALFASALTTNFDDREWRERFASLGAQTDLHFILLSRLNMTFSFGYARAFEPSNRPQEEFMFSVKIL